MKFKSWWQVIWMNKIWRTPKILRHFLLKQVLVFACPWINKNVPLVRSNSLALNSFCILVSQGKLRSEKMMKFVFMLPLICACLYSSRAGSPTQKQVRQSSGLFISEKNTFYYAFCEPFQWWAESLGFLLIIHRNLKRVNERIVIFTDTGVRLTSGLQACFLFAGFITASNTRKRGKEIFWLVYSMLYVWWWLPAYSFIFLDAW